MSRRVTLTQLVADAATLMAFRDEVAQGAIVAFPTDTVWGFGVSPASALGIERLYQIKGRDRDKPLILLINEVDRVLALHLGFAPEAAMVMRRHWPGPLTAVLEVTRELPFSWPLPTLGVRVPDHVELRCLLATLPLGLLTTSANRSGEAPVAGAEAVEAQFGAEVGWILVAPEHPAAPPSTVADLTRWPPTILRQGAVKL